MLGRKIFDFLERMLLVRYQSSSSIRMGLSPIFSSILPAKNLILSSDLLLEMKIDSA